MAFVLLKVGDKYNIPAKTYFCEKTEDLSDLPDGNIGDCALVGTSGSVLYWTEENGWATPK